MANISIIYHHFPHYRAPVLRALARSKRHSYSFFAGLEDFQGIRAFKGDETVTINPIKFNGNDTTGAIDFSGFDRAVSTEFDATIVIGNANARGAWRAVHRAKRNGLATAYWAHGWLKKEPWLKGKVRNYFFSRADRVLTYGTRAKEIAARTGFDSDRIAPIWNSLDWDEQSRLFKKFEPYDRSKLRQEFGMPSNVPIAITVSRVTELCKYEWLIKAASQLRKTGTPIEVWMIGEGPQLNAMRELAALQDVPLHIQGAEYDEAKLAKQIMAADFVASPGKVGLTAMHGLAFGTPIVTHSDLDHQMPEVEAIEDGISGVFFQFGQIDDLARAITDVINLHPNLGNQRTACRASLEGRFTPQDQVKLIDDAMDEILRGK